jgi:hypothetical protein
VARYGLPRPHLAPLRRAVQLPNPGILTSP